MKMVFMNKWLSGLGAVVSVAALVLATGCANVGYNRPATASEALHIVVAFYPFLFIAQKVAGSQGSVTSLTQPGAEPHDLELTPRQVAGISDADLVIYEKSFQSAVDEAVQQSDNGNVLDTSTIVPLQDLGTHSEQTNTHADQRFLDPHVWLDPRNMVTITTAVAAKLSALDSSHAADFRTNARHLTTQLLALDNAYRGGLANCQRTQFITQHEAFGYLARRYGLTQIAVGGLSPDTEPSPARIAEVQQTARDYGVTTIFYETLVSPAVAQAIAGDLHLKTDVLDPVEGITPQSRGQDYLAVMKSNLTSLRAANGCR
jgi:zinc transport system substrate-binding protein